VPPKAVFTSLRRPLIAGEARESEVVRERKKTNASANRERVPPSAESGRPGGVIRADRASSSGPARDGCHCFVTAERGCGGNFG